MAAQPTAPDVSPARPRRKATPSSARPHELNGTSRPVSRRLRATAIFDVPADGNRYEVLDGELYVTPAPNIAHQRCVTRLAINIGGYLQQHPLGELFVAPVAVVFNEFTGAQPDLVYVSTERAGIITRRGVEGVPDLVIEVLSPSTSAIDRGIKFRIYERTGVMHYWLADPRRRQLLAYRLEGTSYILTGTYGPGEVFQPDLFPDLALSIDALWV